MFDRGYMDFARLYRFHQQGSFFVIRAKSPLRAKRRYSRRVDRSAGVMCDQRVVLTVYYSHKAYPEPLRRVRIKDLQTGKSIVLLTNNWGLPALTIGQLYRSRWQIELFFKWIKQHLRIKAFFGMSPNAVKTQIWIAVAVYVLVAIIKKHLNLSASLYELLQILSLTMFETTPLHQLLNRQADEGHAQRLSRYSTFNRTLLGNGSRLNNIIQPITHTATPAKRGRIGRETLVGHNNVANRAKLTTLFVVWRERPQRPVPLRRALAKTARVITTCGSQVSDPAQKVMSRNCCRRPPDAGQPSP